MISLRLAGIRFDSLCMGQNMTDDGSNVTDTLPRYSLWALAIVMAVCGLVFGILRLLGPLAACWTVLMLLVIGVHLLASYVGHRMDRDRKKKRNDWPSVGGSLPIAPVETHERKNPNLAERTGLSVWQVYSTAQATVMGGALGVVSGRWIPPQEFNWAVLIVCVISGAALCGIWCFVIGNLTEHVVRSWIAAHRGEVS